MPSESPYKVEQSSNPPQKSSAFWALPPEIRNNIFEEAYGNGHVRKVRSLRLAMLDENPSECVIEHLLVSKQWFSEVASIFAHSTNFEFPSFADMVYAVSRLPKYITDHISSISWHSGLVNRLEVDQDDVKHLLEKLPGLRSVRVHINSMLMIQKSTNYRKAITRDELQECDFAMCHGVDALKRFRGLREFLWVENQDVMAMRRYYTADRVAVWERNIAAFEQYILAEASQPRWQ